LYEEPEKPDAPADYIREQLGGQKDQSLKQENEKLKIQVQDMQITIDKLNAELAKHAQAVSD
jgi:predicted RNase H-like nuclease (RuvC/YqgF family)